MTDEPPQRNLYSEDTPQLESTVTLSKNGRYLIHRTIITHIKPSAYYEAILRTAAERRKEAHE